MVAHQIVSLQTSQYSHHFHQYVFWYKYHYLANMAWSNFISRAAVPPSSRLQPPTPSRPMDGPITPSRGAEVEARIENINQQWDLGLPTSKGSQTPVEGQDTGETARGLIAFFVFQKQQAFLDEAIANFASHARTVHSDWRYKPSAETDVMTRRRPSALPGFAPRSTSAETVQLLIQALCRFLREERAKVIDSGLFRSRSALAEPGKLYRVLTLSRSCVPDQGV